MTLIESCDKLRVRLQKWYNQNKNDLGYFPHWNLNSIKEKFLKENNCEKHNSDIRADFKIVPDSYKRSTFCSNGCCSFDQTAARSKTNGIVVEPMDWDKANYLSKYENVKPINWDRESYLNKCEEITMELQ